MGRSARHCFGLHGRCIFLGSARLLLCVRQIEFIYFIATAAGDSLLVRADALLPDRLGWRASDLGPAVKCAACALVVIAAARGQNRFFLDFICLRRTGRHLPADFDSRRDSRLSVRSNRRAGVRRAFHRARDGGLSDGGRAQPAHVALTFI